MSRSFVRATAESRKSRDGKHGFQVCRLVHPDGGYQEFDQYFNPSREALALAPGDYELSPSAPKVKDGRLVFYAEFTPAKALAKAAA